MKKTIKHRGNKMLIGTIRWDAWLPSYTQVGGAVARTLNPIKYRCRAPYFTILDAEGKVDYPEYTMDIWESEADYAIDAGIDYWAYCWYLDSDPMSLARKYHTQSPKNKQIKMCAVLGVHLFTETELRQLLDVMKEDYYLKIDGMPLIYVYGGTSQMDKDAVENLRKRAAAEGIPQLLMASMISGINIDPAIAFNAGYDIQSFYSCPIGGEEGPYTFAELAKIAEDRVENVGAKLYNGSPIQIIPSFTTGRDPRPRVDNPVFWCPNAYKPNNYAETATDKEIADHAIAIFNWTYEHPEQTAANCVVSYGWNEHDEGGWLCPTAKVDETGDFILDENGKLIPETSRLYDFKAAVQSFREKEAEGIKQK